MFDDTDNIYITMNIVRNRFSLRMKPVTALGMKQFGMFNFNNPFNL
jgi:hypothetical protein